MVKRISIDLIVLLRRLLNDYRQEVEAAELSDETRKTYVRHAETFVRWLDGDFTPGATRHTRSGHPPDKIPHPGGRGVSQQQRFPR